MSSKKIISTDIIGHWADDEFAKELSLENLEKEMEFALENSHFRDIPTAKEIETSGIDLGEMSALQMRLIERVYKYMYLLKKENEVLKKEIEILKANGK